MNGVLDCNKKWNILNTSRNDRTLYLSSHCRATGHQPLRLITADNVWPRSRFPNSTAGVLSIEKNLPHVPRSCPKSKWVRMTHCESTYQCNSMHLVLKLYQLIFSTMSSSVWQTCKLQRLLQIQCLPNSTIQRFACSIPVQFRGLLQIMPYSSTCHEPSGILREGVSALVLASTFPWRHSRNSISCQ